MTSEVLQAYVLHAERIDIIDLRIIDDCENCKFGKSTIAPTHIVTDDACEEERASKKFFSAAVS